MAWFVWILLAKKYSIDEDYLRYNCVPGGGGKIVRAGRCRGSVYFIKSSDRSVKNHHANIG